MCYFGGSICVYLHKVHFSIESNFHCIEFATNQKPIIQVNGERPGISNPSFGVEIEVKVSAHMFIRVYTVYIDICLTVYIYFDLAP